MDMYSWDEIKETGDCQAFCRDVLGLQSQGNVTGEWVSFNNPWRPGADSGSFRVSKSGYRDFVSDETGSIIDLCANARFSGDTWQAAEFLGKHLNMVVKDTLKMKKEFVCAYDYTDMEGKILYQVVRWKVDGPKRKTFTQQHPDPKNPDKWIKNMKGIKPVLYRRPDWANYKWVCVVGGEKDADNLLKIGVPATTNSGGEGHWKDSFNKEFKGKKVWILPDNDDAGYKHAEHIYLALKGIAAERKIVALPGLEKKGDVSDWLEAGGDKAKLIEFIAKTEGVLLDAVSIAKRANETAFSNYREEWVKGPDGNKRVRTPHTIGWLMDDVSRRFQGFPRSIGEELFDFDHDTKRIRIFRRAQSMFAWISEKSKKICKWPKNLEGAVTQEQLFEAIQANAFRYSGMSGVPHFPLREDVFYTYDDIPEPTPDSRYFHELCEKFNPTTEQDRILIQVLFATPLFFQYACARPMFIIDSETGQGAGKSMLACYVGMLYGTDMDSEAPFRISQSEFKNEQSFQRKWRQLFDSTGRKKRIIMVDNVTGFFECATLASCATDPTISGLKQYGHESLTRANDLTYIITSNSATVSRDFADRAFFVDISKPERPERDWEEHTMSFIKNNRLQIISDIIQVLAQKAPFKPEEVHTRFQTWEREVLVKVCGSQDTYDDVINRNKMRQVEADSELEEAAIVGNYFKDQIDSLDIDPKETCVWLTSQVINLWATTAIPGFGGKTGRNARHKLKNFAKQGSIPELERLVDKRFGNVRGMLWNSDLYTQSVDSGRFRIIQMKSDGVIEAIGQVGFFKQ